VSLQLQAYACNNRARPFVSEWETTQPNMFLVLMNVAPFRKTQQEEPELGSIGSLRLHTYDGMECGVDSCLRF